MNRWILAILLIFNPILAVNAGEGDASDERKMSQLQPLLGTYAATENTSEYEEYLKDPENFDRPEVKFIGFMLRVFIEENDESNSLVVHSWQGGRVQKFVSIPFETLNSYRAHVDNRIGLEEIIEIIFDDSERDLPKSAWSKIILDEKTYMYDVRTTNNAEKEKVVEIYSLYGSDFSALFNIDRSYVVAPLYRRSNRLSRLYSKITLNSNERTFSMLAEGMVPDGISPQSFITGDYEEPNCSTDFTGN